MFNVEKILEAQKRIAPYIVETPLLRLPALDSFLGCEVYVKAECMQITGAFKLRGALNAALSLTPEELKNGIVCASSGNHGRGIAYTAKMLGTTATIVMPYTAPEVKVKAIKALGAEVVQCDVTERFAVAEKICKEKNANLIPPYNDERVMAGQGTAGLEIAAQAPDLNMVVVPISGGGLISGVATAIKAKAPYMKVYGAEPAPLPRYTESLKKGEPVAVPAQKTMADALVSQMPGAKCFPVVKETVDEVFPVEDAYMLKAQKLLLLEGKLVAEPSSCIGMGAVLQGLLKVNPKDKVCFLVSGGSVGLSQLAALETIEY